MTEVCEPAQNASVPEVPPADAAEKKSETPRRYALSMRWGDFNARFELDVTNPVGRQQRMMVLGFYYGPILAFEHQDARTCWAYMKREMEHAGGCTFTADGFRAHVVKQLATVVQKDDGSGEHEPDPRKDARLVLPGTFCFRHEDELGREGIFQELRRRRFEAEDRAWTTTPALGKVPLVVKAVDRDTGGPAENVPIVFELVEARSPADQLQLLSGISTLSERTRSPRQFVESTEKKDLAPPFAYNAPTASGGCKPPDVRGTLLVCNPVPETARAAALDRQRPSRFSVVVPTDAKGEAQVVLDAPRTAGDCLRVKAYVHPDRGTQESVPPDAREEVKTGVLTVWRQLRLSRIIVKPKASAAALAAMSPPPDPGLTGDLGTIDTAFMKREYAKAFCHLVVDRDAQTPLEMKPDEYARAIREARDGAKTPFGFDVEALVRTDFDSPYMFWLADDATYNRNKRAFSWSLDKESLSDYRELGALVDRLSERFCAHFSKGCLPGVTVLRAETGDSYSYWWYPRRPAGARALTTSGVAMAVRGCYLFYPDATYQSSNMPYPLTVNVMHEMGHVLFLRHHYTNASDLTAGFPANHDQDDDCLMGYLRLHTHDHCGKCLLKLRGWDETKL